MLIFKSIKGIKMKSILIKLFLLSLFINYANAEYLATYYAKLAKVDHYNSSGVALNSVAAIIRQDRFNYHIRGIKQYGDTWDPIFSDKSNRATMERMLRRGNISAYARNKILYGTPLIKVVIYRDHVNITVEKTVPKSTVR